MGRNASIKASASFLLLGEWWGKKIRPTKDSDYSLDLRSEMRADGDSRFPVHLSLILTSSDHAVGEGNIQGQRENIDAAIKLFC